jgi:hypothetical protein
VSEFFNTIAPYLTLGPEVPSSSSAI